jgi:hypothetical protein
MIRSDRASVLECFGAGVLEGAEVLEASMQPIAHAIPRAIAELLKNAPLSPGKVEFAWKTIVGPAMERGTSVRLEGHKLLVEARTGAWAREVSRSSHVILRRMELLLGPDVVQELIVRV